MKKLLAGLGSLILILAWVIGFPVVLFLLAGNPFPTAAQWNAIVTLTPDYGNIILFTKVLPLLLWVIWAAFTAPFLVELFASFRGVKTQKKFRATRWQQNLSAGLIGAVALTFAGLGGLSGAVPANAATVQSVSAGTAASAPVVRTPIQQTPVQQQAPPTVHDEQVTVQEGDTLFGISERITGDGNNYPEIVDATQGVQPDGQTLTDPDLIQPGWVVNVPVADAAVPTAPAPAPTTPAPAPQTSTSSPGADAPVTHPPGGAVDGGSASAGVGSSTAATAAPESPVPAPSAPAAAERPAPQAVAPVTEEADQGIDWSVPLMTAGGIGGLLAAGLISALSIRRTQQRRRRAAGERIALPAGEAQQLELEMEYVSDPTSVDDVDNALRTLQAWAEETGADLPELVAVRIADEEVALYLAGPADLPDPFESVSEDGTAWIVRPGRAVAPERPTVSPYPALATIGTDANGGFLLLDLEQIGSLNVNGDDEIAVGMLNALASELALNPWSEDIQVTLVGMDEALARKLNRARIQQVADVPALVRNLRADMEDRREALDSYGVGGVLEARTRATDMESWAPHIVILAEPPVGALRDELAALVERMPRLGIATVSHGDPLVDGATINVRSSLDAEYCSGGSMPPMPFRPQILAGKELDAVREQFAITEQAGHPADLVAEHPQAPAAVVAESEPETVPTDDAATPAAETEAEAPAVDAAPAVTAATDVEPAAAAAAEVDADPAVVVPDWPAPMIRLLGPVDAEGIADAEALPGRGLELLAFLLLQNGPVQGSFVQSQLWPDKYDPKNGNARTLAKQVRAALGHDPEGNPLLPEGRAADGFRAHPAMTTDWHIFCRLIGPDLKTTSNENLLAAVRLVRGVPFAGVKRQRGWWTWQRNWEETMRQAIVDAAAELAHRALGSSRFDDARTAARAAQAADPLVETGWRLEIETAMKAGDADAFNRVVEEMYERIGTDTELDDETVELIDAAHKVLPGLS
ncbi:LysM peptidoglycan-binding domain-containing protein [Microbacterium xylanilyticum]